MAGHFPSAALALAAILGSGPAWADGPVAGLSFLGVVAQSGTDLTVSGGGATTVVPPTTLDCTDPDGCLVSAEAMFNPDSG